MNKLIKKECPFADEIVSYIYDEIGGPEQNTFEGHLADCMKCTDEFAAVSEARFSVFEWQKEEFAPLATPRFVIPYETKTASWFDALKGLLTGSMWPVGVAASLLVCIGLGVILTNRADQSLQSVVMTPVTSPVTNVAASANPVEVANNAVPAKQVTGNDEKVIKASVNVTKANSGVRTVKTNAYSPIRTNRLMVAETIRTGSTGIDPNSKKNLRKAPALSNFDEDDDNTLRLADLFDEGGV